jgi:fucose permease
MDQPPPPSAPVAHRRLMIASACAMIIFGGGVAIPSVCQDTIGNQFGLNFEQRGLLTTARMAALLVTLLGAGYLGERFGKRHFLFWGLVVIALGQALTAHATGYVPLLAAVATSGAGKGVMEALVNPLVAQLNPLRSARLLNVINGLFSVGLVFAALGAGELLQAGYSWRLPFWLWVAPALFGATLYLTRRYPSEATHGYAGRRRKFLVDPLFWLLFAGMAMGGGCEAGLTSWGPNFVAAELGASARSGAWTIALFGAFMAAGRFATGGIAHLVAPLRLMMISALACAVVTAGIGFTHSLWSAWTLFALGGLFVACFWPTLLSVASDHIATGSTSLFAMLAGAGIMGCVVVPWAIGRLGDMLGLRAAVMLLPVSMVLLVALLLAATALVARRARQAASVASEEVGS